MPSLKNQFEELNEDVERLIESVETDTDVGREIRNSLDSLHSGVSSAIENFDDRISDQMGHLLTTFRETRDLIVQRIELFTSIVSREMREQSRQLGQQLEGMSNKQIGAMFASAWMVQNAVNQAQLANDPQVQMGRRWGILIQHIVRAYNNDDDMTFRSLVEDMILNGFTRDQAKVMIRKLEEYNILQCGEGSSKHLLTLDPDNETFTWMVRTLNSGIIPLLRWSRLTR